MRFFQPHQYVSLDYARQDLFMIDVSAGAGAAAALMAAQQAGTAAAGSRESLLPPGLSLKRPEVRPGEPLRLEIESFLECVRERKTPRVSGEDGRRALALALDINAAIAAHAERAGLDRFSKAGISKQGSGSV
jgi:predicted dehydrogenase